MKSWKSILTSTSALIIAGMHMTSFALDLSESRNIPDDGKVLLFMGQDSDTLSDYKFDVLDQDITMPRPGGITIYTPLKIFPEEAFPPGFAETPLDSLIDSGNWGDNEHNLRRTMREYPNTALAIGLDLKDPIDLCNGIQPLRAIADTGDADVIALTPQYHRYVDKMVRILKHTKRPVYLRIGYEFDGPWNCYDQDLYKTVFRFIKNRIDALDATNIATVWQTASYPFNDFQGRIPYSIGNPSHFDDWYPGDEYVDWVGMSTFYGSNYATYQLPGVDDFLAATPRNIQTRVLDFARDHNKPVMIAEAAPAGFDIEALTASPIFIRVEQSITAQELWQSWYADWFNYIEENKDIIRAVAYINANWNEAPLWRCDAGSQTSPGESVPVDPNNPDAPACPGGAYWGDTRVQANDEILTEFKQSIQNEIFVNGGLGKSVPGALIDDTLLLDQNQSHKIKLIIPEDGALAIKLRSSHKRNGFGLLKVSYEGKTRYVKLGFFGKARVKFPRVKRGQGQLEIEPIWGSVELSEINSRLFSFHRF